MLNINDNYVECPNCHRWYLAVYGHICNVQYNGNSTFTYSFENKKVELLEEILEVLKRIENMLEAKGNG